LTVFIHIIVVASCFPDLTAFSPSSGQQAELTDLPDSDSDIRDSLMAKLVK